MHCQNLPVMIGLFIAICPFWLLKDHGVGKLLFINLKLQHSRRGNFPGRSEDWDVVEWRQVVLCNI